MYRLLTRLTLDIFFHLKKEADSRDLSINHLLNEILADRYNITIKGNFRRPKVIKNEKSD